MPLLQGTLLAAVFLLPGVFSLAFALAPRGRAMRHSSLSTRAFGLILFSVADWVLALLLYELLVRDCGPTLAILLFGADPKARDAALANLITFPSAVWIGGGLMTLAVVITGGSVGLFHSAALTGMAVHDYRLKCDLLPCAHRWWARLTASALWCSRCRHRWWVHTSKCVDWALRRIGLSTVFQPLGAGYWLVIQKAAQVLQWSSEDGEGGDRVARVYVDVVQGDEPFGEGKVGVLYKGTVKHLVCETDGNIVFLLLDNAGRWRGYKRKQDKAADAKEIVVPGSDERDEPPRSPWVQIEKSAAFAIEGKSIRNISFRLVDKPFTLSVQKEDPWISLKEALGQHADQVQA